MKVLRLISRSLENTDFYEAVGIINDILPQTIGLTSTENAAPNIDAARRSLAMNLRAERSHPARKFRYCSRAKA